MAPHRLESQEPKSPNSTQSSYFSDEEYYMEVEVSPVPSPRRLPRRPPPPPPLRPAPPRRNNEGVVPYNHNKAIPPEEKAAPPPGRFDYYYRTSCCLSRRLLALVLGLATLLVILYGIVLCLHSKGIRIVQRSSRSVDFTTPVPMNVLAVHETPENCWLAIAGHIYDLTDYTHPGGDAYIHGRCGRDSTSAFDKQHSRHYLQLIERFARGQLQNETSTGGQQQQQQLQNATEVNDETEDGARQKPTNLVNNAPVPAFFPVPIPAPFPVPAPVPFPAFDPVLVPAPFPSPAFDPAPFPAFDPFPSPVPVPAPVIGTIPC
jgi:Cytochrome b5-like Heme/Steroid binding domain